SGEPDELGPSRLAVIPAFERCRKLSDDTFPRDVQPPQLVLEGATVRSIDLHVELHNFPAKQIMEHLCIIATNVNLHGRASITCYVCNWRSLTEETEGGFLREPERPPSMGEGDVCPCYFGGSRAKSGERPRSLPPNGVHGAGRGRRGSCPGPRMGENRGLF